MALTTFTAAQVLTAAQLNAVQANDYNQTVSTKTASYTLVAADKGTRVVMNVASANTVTVNTSLFSAGDTLVIQNIGAGVTTVTAGTATVSSAGPLAIPQNGSGLLYFTSAGVSIFYPSAVTVATPPASGLTFIAKTVLTAATQHNILNCFSTTYDHYTIKFTSFLNVTTINMRFGTSGTPDTGSNYQNTGTYNDSSAVSSAFYNFNASSATLVNNASASSSGLFLDVSSPFLAAKTTFMSTAGVTLSGQTIGNLSRGVVNTTTSYTDLVLLSASDISGTISIYGFANS
jgi:hypothetical protein